MNAFEAITQYSVGERSTSDAWSKLVTTTSACKSKQELHEFLLPYEEQYMETFHADTEGAKTPKGKWKYRTYLPKAYPSAKSTIGTAIESNIQLFDENNTPRPKSVVAKEIAAIKTAEASTMSEYDKAANMVVRLKKQMDKLDEEERYTIINMLEQING